MNVLRSDNLSVVHGRPSDSLALANCHLASDLPFFLEFWPQVTKSSEIVALRNLSNISIFFLMYILLRRKKYAFYLFQSIFALLVDKTPNLIKIKN